MDDSTETRPPLDLEFSENLEACNSKLAELRACYNYLKQENINYKKRHAELERIMTSMNNSLESNVRIFGELLGDMEGALEMGRISFLNRAYFSKPVSNQEDETISSKQKIQGAPVIRRNIENVEPVHFDEIVVHRATSPNPVTQEETNSKWKTRIAPPMRRKREDLGRMQFDDIDTCEEPISAENIGKPCPDLLATIEDESENVTLQKTLFVRLTQLPDEIILKHFSESANSKSFVLQELSFQNSVPDFTSTPDLKLEHMRQLGLFPAALTQPKSSNIVTVRKRTARRRGEDDTYKLQQTDKEKVVQNKIKEELESSATHSRPQRKARPQDVKVVSSKKKMRKV